MKRTIQLPIKGTFYYSAFLAMQDELLNNGTALILIPEPENTYDRYALQIWLPISQNINNQEQPGMFKSELLEPGLLEPGLLLGYVPKSLSKNFHTLYTNNQLTDLHIIHAAQQGKRIEIDCQITIYQAWLPYLSLFIQSKLIAKLYLLKRTKERWFKHHS